MGYLRNANDRTDRWAAIWVGIAATALAVFIFAGCISNPDGSTSPDWNRIDIAGDEVIVLLETRAKAREQSDPEGAESLREVRAAVQMLDEAVDRIIEEGSGFTEFNAYLDGAIAIVDTLIEQTGDEELLLTLGDARVVLSLIRVLAA